MASVAESGRALAVRILRTKLNSHNIIALLFPSTSTYSARARLLQIQTSSSGYLLLGISAARWIAVKKPGLGCPREALYILQENCPSLFHLEGWARERERDATLQLPPPPWLWRKQRSGQDIRPRLFWNGIALDGWVVGKWFSVDLNNSPGSRHALPITFKDDQFSQLLKGLFMFLFSCGEAMYVNGSWFTSSYLFCPPTGFPQALEV